MTHVWKTIHNDEDSFFNTVTLQALKLSSAVIADSCLVEVRVFNDSWQARATSITVTGRVA